MTDDLLADSIEQLLSGRCDLQRVRQVEADDSGAAAASLWQELAGSGFADALVAEARGGAGLGLEEAGAIALACGRHALPVPLALTMVVRAALAEAALAIPDGSISVATSTSDPAGGAFGCAAVAFGMSADHVLVDAPSGGWLLACGAAQRVRAGGRASLSADLCWTGLPGDAPRLPRGEPAAIDWRAVGAAITAAQIAGAAERVSQMTIAYANDRVQFGKPIGKIQAIQQQLSVMAEQGIAARTAALLGLAGGGWRVDPLRAAVAKVRAGEAAATVAAIAHAVHGAIGVTEEFDLQMFTRRLHEWRMQYGGESYWSRRIGRALLDASSPPLQFVQDRLSAAAARRA